MLNPATCRATNISTATSTAIRFGHLVCITVNKPTLANTVTVYDGSAATGTKLATIAASGTSNTYWYLTKLLNGYCTVVTAGTDDITVICQ